MKEKKMHKSKNNIYFEFMQEIIISVAENDFDQILVVMNC